MRRTSILSLLLLAVFSGPALANGSGSLAADIQKLCVDTQGRGLGTEALESVASWLEERFRSAGLEATGDERYRQDFVSKDGLKGSNIIGLLPGTDPDAGHVLIGAHYDHLGIGPEGSPHAGIAFPGADDNASGVAVLLDILGQFHSGAFPTPQRTTVFVAFSGEESGLLGSRHYVAHPVLPLDQLRIMINLDTVGRMTDDKLSIFGSSSAAELESLLKGINYAYSFELENIAEGNPAGDGAPFAEKGIVEIQLFTGAHADYHRPSDTADKLNMEGLRRIADFSAELLDYVAQTETPLSFIPAGSGKAVADESKRTEKKRRVSLGSIPDFNRSEGGVLLTGILPGSPAEKAGLLKGDIIIEFGGSPVEDLTDYSEAMKRFEPGDEVKVVLLREDQRKELMVTLVERK